MSLWEKIEGFIGLFDYITAIFLSFAMVIIYLELILPHLTWEKWIISPIWVMVVINLAWRLGYKEFIKDDKK